MLERTAGSTRRQPTTTPHHPPSPSSRLARTFHRFTYSLLRRMILAWCSAALWWVSTSTAALRVSPKDNFRLATLNSHLRHARHPLRSFARSPGHQVGFRPGGQCRHRTAAPGQHVAVESRAGGARDDQDAAVRACAEQQQRRVGWTTTTRSSELLRFTVDPLAPTRSPRPAHPDALAASITACR